MKGIPGLLVALGLGIAGALANWFYMAQKARELDMVEFIGIADSGVKAGEVFKSEHLVRVPIPQRFALRLRDSAPTYRDASLVIGTTAYRDFRDGEIVLHQDLLAPPGYDLKKDLGPNDQVVWVTVDSRGFVPSFFSGGDEVSFIVPKMSSNAPPRGASPGAAQPSAQTELIGPFHILALGNRRGSYERTRAAGQLQSQENVIAIRVKRVSENQLEPKAQELLDRLRLSNNQALGIVMHSGKRSESPTTAGAR